jgi:hypothetical protein
MSKMRSNRLGHAMSSKSEVREEKAGEHDGLRGEIRRVFGDLMEMDF